MKSAILKRKIGIFYFVFFVVFLILSNEITIIELQRFLICCSFGSLGLWGRTFVYYGFLREDENRELSKKEIEDCEFAYFLYYPLGLLAVISIIFVVSYENLKNMDIKLFFWVAFFLFSALGFGVYEALKHFLLKLEK